MTTSITLRSTKGSALTHAEMDANLTNLQTTADAAKAATDTLTANKAEAAALGVANTDQNMGSFTGTTIADNVSAKVGMQSLETAVETKANATAVGVTSSAADMGTYTGTTIPDNETVKQNIQTLETAVEARPTSATLALTTGAAAIGANDASSGAKYTTVQGFITYLLSSVGSAIVGFLQAGTGAVARTVQAELRDRVSVKQFGATGDGTTDDTAAFTACYNYCAANDKTMYIPAGTYRAFLVVTVDNFSIVGDGSAVTIIKLPNNASHTIIVDAGPGTQTGVPCVIDYGQIGAGNFATARTAGYISGLTLDGNKANTSVPGSDLFGWGLAFTAYSKVTYHDIVAQNCHCGGVGTFINSNYHIGEARVEECGKSTVAGATRPGFDVNSSKYSVWDFVSKDCAYGARLLDNCYANTIRGTINNATSTGFVYSNQTVNASYANDITVTVYSGCADYAVTVGAKCYASSIRATIANITGVGIRTIAQASASDNSRGNQYFISTYRCGSQSCYIEQSSDRWVITTTEDGRTGAQGSFFAVDVYGDDNLLDVNLTDTSTWQVRGVVFRSGADNNRLIAYRYTNTANPFSNSGTGNIWSDTFYSGSATYDPANLVDGAGVTTTVSVSGAVLGDFARASFSLDLQGIELTAWVSAADTVSVRFQNETGGAIDLGSGTIRARVEKI